MLNDIDFVFKFLLQFKPAMYRRVHILTKNCHFSQEGAVPACKRYRPGPVKGLTLTTVSFFWLGYLQTCFRFSCVQLLSRANCILLNFTDFF